MIKIRNFIAEKGIIYINCILFVMSVISLLKGVSNGLEEAPVDFQYEGFRLAIVNHDYSGIVQFPSMYLHICLLGLMSYRVAQIVWLCLQLIVTLILIYSLKELFFQKMPLRYYSCLVLLMISGAPYRTNLSNLQYSLFAYAFFCLGLLLAEREHEYLGGLCISLSIFKIQLIAPLLLILFFRRYYKTIITLIITQVISLIFSIFYFKDAWGITFGRLKFVFGNFGTDGSKFIDLGVIFQNPIIHYFIVIMIVGLMLIVTIKLNRNLYLLYFSWLNLCTLVIVYHRIYDYFMLMIPLGCLFVCRNSEDIKGKKGLWDLFTFIYLVMLVVINYGVTINEAVSIGILRVLFYVCIVGFTAIIIKKVRMNRDLLESYEEQ